MKGHPSFRKRFPMMKEIFLIFIVFSTTTFADTPDWSYNYGEYIEVDHILKNMPPARPSGIPYTSAVAKYGKAVVKEGEIKVWLKKKPWSSWWYPNYEDRLFTDSDEGEYSTLKRYDRYTKLTRTSSGSSRQFEEENIYNAHSAKWAGLCHAWAIASIMEDEPIAAVTKRGIKFRVEDLKALLIKTYEKSFPGKEYTFGQRNNGRFGDVYEDLYPEQLHTILNAELLEKKQPFIMDFDAGYQVWNVPVFGARVRIKKDLDNLNVVHVSLLLRTASPFVKPNYVGTNYDDRFYYYDLFGNWDGDKFIVDYGVWTKGNISDSRREHPDFIAVKPDSSVRKSRNEHIDVKIVDKILEGSR